MTVCFPNTEIHLFMAMSLRNVAFQFVILLFKWISFCKSILYSQLKVYKSTKTSHLKYYSNFQLNYTSRTLNTQQIEPLRYLMELKLRNKNLISFSLPSPNFKAHVEAGP